MKTKSLAEEQWNDAVLHVQELWYLIDPLSSIDEEQVANFNIQ